MVLWCPVGVSVLCVVTDPACQSNGQPYSGQNGKMTVSWLGYIFKFIPNNLTWQLIKCDGFARKHRKITGRRKCRCSKLNSSAHLGHTQS
jgi:hypothetical protein